MRPLAGMLAIAMAAIVSLASCNPEAKAVSGLDIKISFDPYIISSGFVQMAFDTNKEAYYHVGIVPVDEAPDSISKPAVRAFMNLKLDEAYTKYIQWRHSLLEEGVPYIAEFPTHSLQYGYNELNFNYLEPGTDYMVYAFVVDSKTNKPDGRLFTYFLTTEQETPFEVLDFEYRVRGEWDYVYPVFYYEWETETYSEIIDFVPWVGATIDSLQMHETTFPTVPDYFWNLFGSYVDQKMVDKIHFGIYTHDNNGYGDGSSSTMFEEGHTYYTAVALMDGYLTENAFYIYKFHWEGEDTQLYFRKADAMQTDW